MYYKDSKCPKCIFSAERIPRRKFCLAMSRVKNEIVDISLKKLREFFASNENVCFAFIFGSYAKGKQRKYSDLDIAIYFEKPPQGLDLFHLINTLSELTGKEVDIIVLNNASAFLRHQIMNYGIPLIIKDELIYRRFREKTISDYDEYKFISGMNIYD